MDNPGYSQLVPTVFEMEEEIDEVTRANAHKLEMQGITPHYGVNSKKLSTRFNPKSFDTIIFQFPHSGSRDPKYNRNPNFVMIRKFLKEASLILKPNGTAMITTVNSAHYEGAFQFQEAAEASEFSAPESYRFDPKVFKGYSHVNTHDDESGVKNHKKFTTWVFHKQNAASSI